LGESFLEKMEISEYVLEKNHGKLSHLRKLDPKIISNENSQRMIYLEF
jgi:hypothetical protein